jgi:phosphate/sulfate permease
MLPPSAPPNHWYSPPRQPLALCVPPQPMHQRPRSSWLKDSFRGAVLGDFATEVHLPGAVTHAVLGFVPGIGTVMAVRDLVACWLDADWLGMVLNLLAVMPVLGGVPKTVDVLHGVHRVHRQMKRSARRKESGVTPQEIRRRRGRRLYALGMSLLLPVLGLLLGVGTVSALQMVFTHVLIGVHGPFTGNAPLIVTLVFGGVELVAGEALCIRSRAWLGMLLLPPALLLGLLLPTLLF